MPPVRCRRVSDLSLGSSQAIVTPGTGAAATIDTNGFNVGLPGGIGYGSDGDLVKMGNGTLDLSGMDNTSLQGDVVVNGGFVAADNVTNLGFSESALIFDGGGLQWTSTFDIPAEKVIKVRSGGATFDTNGFNVTVAANLGAVFGIDTSGTAGGIAVMDSSTNGSGVLFLTGDNICHDGTRLEGGTLKLGNSTALGSSTGSLNVDAGELDMNGYSVTVGSLSGSGGLITNNNSSSPAR